MDAATTLVLLAAISSSGAGTYLLLPRRHAWARPHFAHSAGYALAALGALLYATLWAAPKAAPHSSTPASDFLTVVFFYAFGLSAFLGAIVMATSRNPVYNALWFALVLLATAGLFLLVGAQFLAAATVIIYAGAIVVTFLFVIMLAQAQGYALYDRMARAPLLSTLTVFLLLGGSAGALCAVRAARAPERSSTGNDEASSPDIAHLEQRLPRWDEWMRRASRESDRGAALVAARALSARARLVVNGGEARPAGSPPPHVAGLGAVLYTDHLVAIEIAGILLFVALVGGALIALPRATMARESRASVDLR